MSCNGCGTTALDVVSGNVQVANKFAGCGLRLTNTGRICITIQLFQNPANRWQFMKVQTFRLLKFAIQNLSQPQLQARSKIPEKYFQKSVISSRASRESDLFCNSQHENRVCISQMYHEYKQLQAYRSAARLLRNSLRSTPITTNHPLQRFSVPIF